MNRPLFVVLSPRLILVSAILLGIIMRQFIFQIIILLFFSFSSPVFAEVPTVSIHWSPSTVNYGKSSRLIWSSTNATNCTLGGTNTNGSWLGPNRVKSQTVPFSCEGPGGTSETVHATLTVIPPPVPTVSVSWSPSTVNYGEPSTITWSSTNSDRCVLEGVENTSNGSWTGTNRTKSQTSRIYCVGYGGTSSTYSATLTVKPRPPVPTVSMSWSPSTVKYGEPSTLRWSSTNATNCTFNGTKTSGLWLGRNRVRNQTVPFSCDGPGGSSETVHATLTVIPPAVPTVSASWSPSTVKYGEPSTITWSSTNYSERCVLEGVENTPSGSWTGTNRTKSQTSRIYCVGPGGTSETVNTTLTVIPLPVPTVSASWSPSTVNYGEPSTLTWSSTNATSCTLGEGENNGNWVGPNRVRNQTVPFSCVGPGGTSETVNAILTVIPPPVPTVSASWSPSTVKYGEPSTIIWSSTNYSERCVLEGVENTPSGSWTGTNRTKSQTTRIYCVGPGGTSDTVNATLTVLPPLTISGTPIATIAAGQSYSFIPSVIGADSEDVEFSIVNEPKWAVFNSSTGSLTGVPQVSDIGGNTDIIISVSDNTDSVSLSKFNITVTEGPHIIFIHTDILGTPVAETDINGDVL